MNVWERLQKRSRTLSKAFFSLKYVLNDEEYINDVITTPIYTPTKENAFSEPTCVKLSPIGCDGSMPLGETSLHSSFASMRARSGEDARLIVRSSARSGEMAQSHRANSQIHQTASFVVQLRARSGTLARPDRATTSFLRLTHFFF